MRGHIVAGFIEKGYFKQETCHACGQAFGKTAAVMKFDGNNMMREFIYLDPEEPRAYVYVDEFNNPFHANCHQGTEVVYALLNDSFTRKIKFNEINM